MALLRSGIYPCVARAFHPHYTWTQEKILRKVKTKMISKETKTAIIAEYKINENDTGSPEVQGLDMKLYTRNPA